MTGGPLSSMANCLSGILLNWSVSAVAASCFCCVIKASAFIQSDRFIINFSEKMHLANNVLCCINHRCVYTESLCLHKMSQ